MNPHTGEPIVQNEVAPVPMTKLALNQVEKMVRGQGITKVKFTNKRGMQLPHSNWLAGVDHDENCSEDEDSDDDNDDDECQPQQCIQDIKLQTDEDVDMEETTDLLHGEQD